MKLKQILVSSVYEFNKFYLYRYWMCENTHIVIKPGSGSAKKNGVSKICLNLMVIRGSTHEVCNKYKSNWTYNLDGKTLITNLKMQLP